MIVATSIAPGNLEIQRIAIDSWIANDLNPISINLEEEIPSLDRSFPDVLFLPIKELDTEETGRKLVYFDQILEALREFNPDVCGIINSDIIIRPIQGIREKLLMHASDGLVFASRYDIESVGDQNGERYPHGYDLFFLNSDLLQIYPNSQFRLGAPWWDLWVPLVPALVAKPTKFISSPIAYHVRHKSGWEKGKEWDLYANIFINNLSRFGAKFNSENSFNNSNQAPNPWLSFCHTMLMRMLASHWSIHDKLFSLEPEIAKVMKEEDGGEDVIETGKLLLSRHLLDALGNGMPSFLESISEHVTIETES